MIKKGIIMEYNNKEAVLFTDSGEFIKFKTNEKLTVGQEYVYKQSTNFKPFLMAASLFIAVILTSFITMYNQVYASMTVTINPQFKIDINRFNRIIRVTPLNKDGEKIAKLIKIKNKKIDDGLLLIVNKAKEEKYITNAYYNKNPKAIKIEINNQNITLAKFTAEMQKQKINIEKINFKLQKLEEKQNKKQEIQETIEKQNKDIKNKLNQNKIDDNSTNNEKINSKTETIELPNQSKDEVKNNNENSNENVKEDNKINFKKNIKKEDSTPSSNESNEESEKKKIKRRNSSNWWKDLKS